MALAVDLYCGLGGWTDGLLAECWDVIGFDNERHVYGDHQYPAQLVVQDVLTIHGSQFKDADLIVASPPCTEYSYMAMPWSRAKQIEQALLGGAEFPEGYKGSKTAAELNALFDVCFQIQREASKAAGRHIPMVVENVRGAQKWVGRSRWAYGSFHLWGDVPALMPISKKFKSSGMNWSDRDKKGQDFTRIAGEQAMKVPSETGRRTDIGKGARFTSRDCGDEGRKGKGSGAEWFDKNLCDHGSKSTKRKAASAMIAKIPFELSSHIAKVFRPE